MDAKAMYDQMVSEELGRYHLPSSRRMNEEVWATADWLVSNRYARHHPGPCIKWTGRRYETPHTGNRE